MAELLDEIHPGEILLEDFMKPMGITARQLAADIDVSPSRISELVHGARPVTADTALRLGLFFGMEPRFWLNLQTEYDMRIAARTFKKRLRLEFGFFIEPQPKTSLQPAEVSPKGTGFGLDGLLVYESRSN